MGEQLVVSLDRGDEKKNSVVYRGESPSGFRYSLYVGNDDVQTLGSPKGIALTLEAA